MDRHKNKYYYWQSVTGKHKGQEQYDMLCYETCRSGHTVLYIVFGNAK